jgi:hypothetical protein
MAFGGGGYHGMLDLYPYSLGEVSYVLEVELELELELEVVDVVIQSERMSCAITRFTGMWNHTSFPSLFPFSSLFYFALKGY